MDARSALSRSHFVLAGSILVDANRLLFPPAYAGNEADEEDYLTDLAQAQALGLEEMLIALTAIAAVLAERLSTETGYDVRQLVETAVRDVRGRLEDTYDS